MTDPTREAADEAVTSWQLVWARHPIEGEERDGLVHCIAIALAAARAEGEAKGRAEGLMRAATMLRDYTEARSGTHTRYHPLAVEIERIAAAPAGGAKENTDGN